MAYWNVDSVQICTLKLPTRLAREADFLVPVDAPAVILELFTACRSENSRDRPLIGQVCEVLDSLEGSEWVNMYHEHKASDTATIYLVQDLRSGRGLNQLNHSLSCHRLFSGNSRVLANYDLYVKGIMWGRILTLCATCCTRFPNIIVVERAADPMMLLRSDICASSNAQCLSAWFTGRPATASRDLVT